MARRPDSSPAPTRDFELTKAFFYLLTRGTPHSDGMPWGSLRAVVAEVSKAGSSSGGFAYTSAGGEALAAELAAELLGHDGEAA